MARIKNLDNDSLLSIQKIADVRANQGETAQKIDDAEAHVVTGPWVARTEREKEIHRIWSRDPGDADIAGIDGPEIRPDVRDTGRPPGPKPPTPGPKPPTPGPKPPTPGPKPPTPGPAPKLSKDYEIIGGTKTQRAYLRNTITNNFSKSELALMSEGLVIEIGTGRLATSGAAGFYITEVQPGSSLGPREDGRPRYLMWHGKVSKKAQKISGMTSYIKLGNGFAGGDVITHEMIHHLRVRRLGAKPLAGSKDLTRAESTSWSRMNDSDREEATTDLESISRHNKWEKYLGGAIERPSPAGYYQLVVPKEKGYDTYWADRITAAELEDRAIVTLPGTLSSRKFSSGEGIRTPSEKLRTSGLQGDKLRENINANYSETRMSKSKMGKTAGLISGQIENVDQYYATVGADGKVQSRMHVRSARRLNKDQLAKRILGGTPGKTVVKFNDKKPKALATFKNPKGFGASKSKNKFN